MELRSRSFGSSSMASRPSSTHAVRPAPQSVLAGPRHPPPPPSAAATVNGRYGTKPKIAATRRISSNGIGTARNGTIPLRSKQRRFPSGGGVSFGLVAFLMSLAMVLSLASVFVTHLVSNAMEKRHSQQQESPNPLIPPIRGKGGGDSGARVGAPPGTGSGRGSGGKASDIAAPSPPRVLALDGVETGDGTAAVGGRVLPEDPMLKVYPPYVLEGEEDGGTSSEEYYEAHRRHPYVEGDCVPMERWQVESQPACNSMHEIDFGALASGPSPKGGSGGRVESAGRGWFRLAWKAHLPSDVDVEGGEGSKTVILKQLRFDREFFDEFFDLHRRDAVAMERLTFSPHVLDVYGFCGQSAINEVANDTIERVAMRYKNKKPSKEFNMFKLHLSYQAAAGVADVHEVDHRSTKEYLANNATMVHYDLNPRNVAVMADGRPKLNDFNVAEFLRWDRKKNQPCGFRGRLHEPWWRAPEEMISSNKETAERYNLQYDPNATLNEKVDVFSLGNILFRILTGHAPKGKSIPERVEEARSDLVNAVPPPLNQYYRTTKDPYLSSVRVAMAKCFEPDPNKRTSARDIADFLEDAILALHAEKHSSVIKKYIDT